MPSKRRKRSNVAPAKHLGDADKAATSPDASRALATTSTAIVTGRFVGDGLPPLPLETWDDIFARLTPRDKALAARCSREWHGYMSALLYRVIYTPRSWQFKHVKALIDTLATRPACAAHVRHFDLAWNGSDYYSCFKECEAVAEQLDLAIANMPNLRILIIPDHFKDTLLDFKGVSCTLRGLSCMPSTTMLSNIARLPQLALLRSRDVAYMPTRGILDITEEETVSWTMPLARKLEYIHGDSDLLAKALERDAVTQGCTLEFRASSVLGVHRSFVDILLTKSGTIGTLVLPVRALDGLVSIMKPGEVIPELKELELYKSGKCVGIYGVENKLNTWLKRFPALQTLNLRYVYWGPPCLDYYATILPKLEKVVHNDTVWVLDITKTWKEHAVGTNMPHKWYDLPLNYLYEDVPQVIPRIWSP
ncbi:hypothetical protein EXIGLDRAFT_842578 [Exidia glandulosa HHB12029]|uniref:F-box domain-containing protein n=1 Tax=Exidia glandulosa HHB12029 TaxID=1314781 RepID=A0A165D7W3_EXIGL|nr:hypothetical protein EXIGLDRAFT_842578 [Exidia glandulosa HHB12029]